MTKQETLPKGVGVAKFDFNKTFRNQLFSGVKVSIMSVIMQLQVYRPIIRCDITVCGMQCSNCIMQVRQHLTFHSLSAEL